jgi:hypothetical protein
LKKNKKTLSLGIFQSVQNFTIPKSIQVSSLIQDTAWLDPEQSFFVKREDAVSQSLKWPMLPTTTASH